MGRRVGLALAAFAVLALGACSTESMSSAGDAAAPAPAAQPPVGAPKQESAGDARQGGTSVAQNRQLVRSATVDLRTADVSDVLGRVKDLAAAQGGYSAQENAQLDHASVTLQVPGDRLDAVLESIGGLDGVEVRKREVRTEDVTEQVVDIETRLANQRASVERVRGLLERASSTAEITQIEGELTSRQSELESLQRRYDTLKGQVALSSLTVTIGSRGALAVAEEQQGFFDAVGGGWRALMTAVGWLLVVVGTVLPFAVVLAVPALAYLWWRRRRDNAVTPEGRSA